MNKKQARWLALDAASAIVSSSSFEFLFEEGYLHSHQDWVKVNAELQRISIKLKEQSIRLQKKVDSKSKQ